MKAIRSVPEQLSKLQVVEGDSDTGQKQLALLEELFGSKENIFGGTKLDENGNEQKVNGAYEDYKDKLTKGSFTNIWSYQNWKNITV